MSVALVLSPDGDVQELNLPGNTRDRLRTMYKVIGCTAVDVVPADGQARHVARRRGRVHAGSQ